MLYSDKVVKSAQVRPVNSNNQSSIQSGEVFAIPSTVYWSNDIHSNAYPLYVIRSDGYSVYCKDSSKRYKIAINSGVLFLDKLCTQPIVSRTCDVSVPTKQQILNHTSKETKESICKKERHILQSITQLIQDILSKK